MKLILKTVSAASLAAVLGACAGGGGVSLPTEVVPMSKLGAADPSVHVLLPSAEQPTSHHSNPAVGKLVAAGKWIPYDWGGGRTDKRFFYQTADGQLYPLLAGSDPFVPWGEHDSDKRVPTQVKMRATEAGDRLVVCCDGYSSAFTPGYIGDADSTSKNSGVRYGVWISRSGQVDMFYGGYPATVSKMQGANADSNYTPTGKATYEVLAFRVRNGGVVASTHDNDKAHDNPSTTSRSLLTVNFSHNRIGGVIRGNADFGDDIVFEDVAVVGGNSFSGSVRSGGQAGQVEGNFYAPYFNYRLPAGRYIGGKATFAGNSELDSVFGGGMVRKDEKYSGDDVNPM